MKNLNIAQKGKYLEDLLQNGHIDAVRPGPLDDYLQKRGFFAHYAWSYGGTDSRHEVWCYFSPIKYQEYYKNKEVTPV